MKVVELVTRRDEVKLVALWRETGDQDFCYCVAGILLGFHVVPWFSELSVAISFFSSRAITGLSERPRCSETTRNNACQYQILSSPSVVFQPHESSLNPSSVAYFPQIPEGTTLHSGCHFIADPFPRERLSKGTAS